MLTLTKQTSASPDAVWAVLSDGWLYAAWVVGASRIRDVEGSWPTAAAKIHHSVGSWPVLLNDETEVMIADTGRLLVLQARTRPFGQARVEIELRTGVGGGTEIEMREDLTDGPLSKLPAMARKALLAPRNRESLRRLCFLAEGGAGVKS